MTNSNRNGRRGSVYLAVLGTAMIASVLALSALGLQRIQHRQLTISAHIRQAQLNAEAAIERGLLIMKQDPDWRSDPNATWSDPMGPGTGECNLTVIDPLDGDLTTDPNSPFIVQGTGISGNAEQHVELYVEPCPQPSDVIKTATNAGGTISGQSGNVDWNAIVAAYKAEGTQININSLPNRKPNLARNPGLTSSIQPTDWDINLVYFPPPTSVTRPSSGGSPGAYLRVQRSDKRAGATNNLSIDTMKPDTEYRIEVMVRTVSSTNVFVIHLAVVDSGGNVILPIASSGTNTVTVPNGWWPISAILRTPNWSATPQRVVVVVNSDHPLGNAGDLYVDSLDVYENTSGRLIYHTALGPGVNPFGTSDPGGIYWIDCGGNPLVIEQSRVLGTLVLLNPGGGSQITNMPIHMSPATPGYPSLVVQGNFTIRATNRALSESECDTNFNPTGLPYEFNSEFNSLLRTSTDIPPGHINDIYPSEIQGLVVVSDNLTYGNQPRIRGQVIVGGTISGTPSFEHRLDAFYNPPPGFTGTTIYNLRPASVRKVVLP